MAEIVRSIWDFTQWIYNEYEDYTECKEEILELKEDLKQLRILLEEYGDKLDCSSTIKKTIFHALLQLNQTVESAQRIHMKFSKKYKTRYQILTSILFNRTKRHIAQVTGCRQNLQFRQNGLQIALQLTTYVDGNQVTSQEDTLSSSDHFEDSSAWKVSYDDIKFKKDKRGQYKHLGSGSFATVYDATIDGSPVAVKEFHCVHKIWKDAEQREYFQKVFEREVNLLSRLAHPNIVDFVGAIADESEEEPEYMIIVEKLSKTLAEISQTMTLERKLEVVLGIANGLAYIHSCNVIHRDIKPDNIMLAADGIPKIIDFGLSKEKEDQQVMQSTIFTPGTLPWISPEKKRGESSTFKSDVYSMGLVIAHFLTGTLPSRHISPVELYQEALKEATGNNDEICKLILQCFNEDPEERPIAAELHFQFKAIVLNSSCNKKEKQSKSKSFIPVSNATKKEDADKDDESHASATVYEKKTQRIKKEIRMEVFAPPGKLGVVIDTPDIGPPIVYSIKDSSCIADKIQVGDKLLAVDDENVRDMTAIKAAKLIGQKSTNATRKLIFLRTTFVKN